MQGMRVPCFFIALCCYCVDIDNIIWQNTDNYGGIGMANINVRIDSEVKKQAEEVFKKIGMTPTTAINLFYHQVILTNSIPFELLAEIPNKTTIKAFKEAKDMERYPENNKAYDNVDEFFEDLNK